MRIFHTTMSGAALAIAALAAAGCVGVEPTYWRDGLALADPAAQGFDPAKLELARAGIEAGIEAGDFPGAVLIVARGDGPVDLETLGVQAPGSTTPMSAQTIFPICSMTKPIVTIAAMTLVEEGRLSLDDPVSDYIPEFDDMEVLVGDGATRPAVTPITIRRLMSHTSGIFYASMRPDSELAGIYNAAGIGFNVDYDAQEFSRRLAALPLFVEPGAQWNYGHSTDVLGAVVEIVAGEPLDQVLEERIFAPLGMDDTGFVQPEADRGRLASGGAPLCVLDAFAKPAFLSGSGGLTSTPEDYLRFAEMLLNDGAYDRGRIVSKATLDEMAVDLAPPGSEDSPLWPGDGMGFGLGFSVVLDEAVRPEGERTLAWWGYEGTHFWVDRKNDVLGIFMALDPAASLPTTPLAYQLKVRNWVYGALEE